MSVWQKRPTFPEIPSLVKARLRDQVRSGYIRTDLSLVVCQKTMAAAGGAGAAAVAAEPDTLDLPVIDLATWFARESSAEASASASAEAKKVAESLHKYGVLIVRDPRATEADNDKCVASPTPVDSSYAGKRLVVITKLLLRDLAA